MIEFISNFYAQITSSLSFLGSEQAFFDWFGQFAYQPSTVYLFVILFMLASSFGLPIPEELTLVSTGLVAYMAKHPEKYPAPFPDAPYVEVHTAAMVAFGAVFISDLLVFTLGKYFGPKVLSHKVVRKLISESALEKINNMANKYSYWVCGIFRFTPGLRFPGHLSCGMSGISYTKFILVDGIAALISVPTQIYLVSYYGEDIIHHIKKFNAIIGITAAIIILVFIVRKVIHHRRDKNASADSHTNS